VGYKVSTLADLLIKVGIDPKGVDKGAAGMESRLKKTWGGIKAGAAVGGLAAGAALMAGMQSMIESSKPVALLQAQLGATGEFAGDIGKAAGNLFSRGVVSSMEEATGAIRAVWQNGLVNEDATNAEIESVGAKLSNLAMISEQEAGNVANAVKQMLRNGLVKNANEGFDLLTRGVQQGVDKAGDLMDTYNEYGTQFRQLGLDGATSMGLMNQAIRAGARDSDTAADALKEFAIRAIDGSKTSADGFKALGLDAQKMTAQIAKGGPEASAGLATVLEKLKAIKDPVKQNAAAVALFGTKAEDLGQALYAMDPTTAAAGLGKIAGAADKAGKTLEESAGAKLESFKRKAQSALVDQLAKAIPYIEKTFGWLQKNSSWVTPLAIGLGILAGAIAIMVVAQMAWNAALALSPVTWIVLGIALIIAGIVLLATKTKFFQTIWGATWGFLKMVGGWIKTVFVGYFKFMFAILMAIVRGIWAGVKMYFGFWNGLFQKVKGWVVTAVTFIWNKWKSFVGFLISIPGKVSGKLRSMWDGLKAGFKVAINYVISKWNSLSFSIPSFSILGKSFGGGTIGVPKIPQLAEGGIVKASPGGTLVNVGEGGQDEAVVPLGRGPQTAARGQAPEVTLVIEGAETEFRRWLNKSIRVKGAVGGKVTA
jgi:phage-related minor tail protein